MELGVDLQTVAGSGPGGRVTAEDVRSVASQAEAAAPPAGDREAEEGMQEEVAAAAEVSAEQEAAPQRGRPLVVERPPLPDFRRWGPVEEMPLQGVRRATARQMSLAWAQIPHVMHQDIADITALEMFRRRHAAEIEQRGGKLTLTILVMQAVVAALKQFPRLNASLDSDGGRLILKHYYHIGVAVDTERGLLVPVVRDVDCKSMVELAVELLALVERTRQGHVNRDELQGGTFTITNAGAIGGTAFTPIINYPEVAILGLARVRLAPVVQGDVEHFTVDARWHLPLHLAFDHRVNDGADAARFVRMVIDMLHDPEALLLHV
jgi:pyruvate dehydrogenase E2 component (dihydrolipoamide acetyltransferase)